MEKPSKKYRRRKTMDSLLSMMSTSLELVHYQLSLFYFCVNLMQAMVICIEELQLRMSLADYL